MALCDATQLLIQAGSSHTPARQVGSPALDAGTRGHVHDTHLARGAVTSAKGAGGKQKWKHPISTAGSATARWPSCIRKTAFPQSWASSTILIASVLLFVHRIKH